MPVGPFGPISSGSSSSVAVANLILNPDAETDTSGWATYSNAAGSSPVNGTGGSPTVTWTRSTSSPLNGSASFLFTKGASNTQGQGVSYDFSVPLEFRSKVLQIQVPYILSSGTFVAGGAGTTSDLTVWIYDVTNSTLIQPTTYNFFSNSTSTPNTIYSNFQTSANASTYRIIIHCGSTSASAYTMKFDDIAVTPTTYSYGTPITDWVAYTPNAAINSGFGTIASTQFFWRRIGDSIQGQGRFLTGTVTSSEARIALPDGLTSADGTKLPTSGVGVVPAGQYAREEGSPVADKGGIIWAGANVNYVTFSPGSVFGTSSSVPISKAVGNAIVGSGSNIVLSYMLPIAGWSAQVQMSDVNDQRIVVAYYKATTNQTVSSTQPANFDTKLVDTHGAVTVGASWNFRAPISGLYSIGGASVYSTTGGAQLIYKNGAPYAQIGSNNNSVNVMGTVIVQMNAGETIDLRTNGGSLTMFGNSSANDASYISIERITNPASITSTETVGMRYYSSVTAISGSLATVTFATKDFDTHNAYAAGAYLIQIPGRYQINLAIQVTGTIALNNILDVQIQKTGTNISESQTYAGGVMTALTCSLGDTIQCNAGDNIRVQASCSATSPVIATSNTKVFLSIIKVGI